jgi:hypothetical protein
MEIEVGTAPQPTTVEVGFSDTSAEEAEIEKQLLEAEQKGTSLGEIEDAKQREAKDKPDTVEDETVSTEGEQPDNSEAPAEKKEQPRDEKGQFAKDDSTYEKARKEKDRLSKSWTQFEAECQSRNIDLEALNRGERTWKDLERCKNFVRQQIDGATAQQKAELEAERQRLDYEARNRGEFSPQEYQAAGFHHRKTALELFEQGEVEEAKKALASSDQCFAAAEQTGSYLFYKACEKDYAETLANQDFADMNLGDPDSDDHKAIVQLIYQEPILQQTANGFSTAARLYNVIKKAARASELEGELTKVTKERDEVKNKIKSLTGLAAAGSQSQPLPRGFDSMSESEQEREVERMFSSSGDFIHP